MVRSRSGQFPAYIPGLVHNSRTLGIPLQAPGHLSIHCQQALRGRLVLCVILGTRSHHDLHVL